MLYLKIAFVSDLLQLVKRLAKNQSISGMCFGKESVWVNIAENANLLPAFWNFKAILLSCPDISGNQGLLPDMPKSYMSYWFGRIIIDALISNPSASGAPLNMAIKTAIGLYENGQPYEEIFESDAFRPENIFYYAGVRNIRDEWAEIWRRVLSIGLSMILSGYTGDNVIQENELTSNLSELMKEIKKMLFSEGVFTAASSAAIQPSQSEDIDSRIIEILENIKAKWLTSSDINMQKTQETKPAIDEEEFEKTVMMSTAGPVQSPNYEASHEETKDIHETVILNAATLAGLAKKAVRKADIKVESTP